MTGILEVLDTHSDRLTRLYVKARGEIREAAKAREETVVVVPDRIVLTTFIEALEDEGFATRRQSAWLAIGKKPGLWKREIWVTTPKSLGSSLTADVVWTEEMCT